jgi:phage major head subunit gpT-like protein
MIVNPQTLRGIYVGFNTLFNRALTTVEPVYKAIATVTPSTTDSETYAWLGDIPGMREWVGDREIQNLAASDYTIKNKSFELTIGVDREAVEDDKIGLYNPSVEMLAQSAAMHPDELIFALLASGFEAKCYDGQPFFSDAHKVGKKNASNKGTAQLSLEAYIAARAAMMSLTNSKGRALNLVPDTLVVPPALEAKARDILVADFINGTRNTMQGTAKPLVVPQLAGHDTAWYLLCTNRPIKPLIYQERKKAKFVSKTAETDDNVFMSKRFLYGADSRGNAGFGFWQMAYGSDGSAQA